MSAKFFAIKLLISFLFWFDFFFTEQIKEKSLPTKFPLQITPIKARFTLSNVNLEQRSRHVSDLCFPSMASLRTALTATRKFYHFFRDIATLGTSRNCFSDNFSWCKFHVFP